MPAAGCRVAVWPSFGVCCAIHSFALFNTGERLA
jgi:hypothetical protein